MSATKKYARHSAGGSPDPDGTTKKFRSSKGGVKGGDDAAANEERERRIFTATQLLGDTLAGTGFSHAIGWLSLLSSLGVTAQGILEMKGITFERRAFLAMGLCFITSSVFTLAKTIRDSAEAEKLETLLDEVAQVCQEMDAPMPRSSLDKELRGAVQSLRGGGYWYLQSVGALVGSMAMTLDGLFRMPDITSAQRRFTTLGIGFVVSSCFFVSNQARDSREAKKWLGMLADDIADMHEGNDEVPATPTRSTKNAGAIVRSSSRPRRALWLGLVVGGCVAAAFIARGQLFQQSESSTQGTRSTSRR